MPALSEEIRSPNVVIYLILAPSVDAAENIFRRVSEEFGAHAPRLRVIPVAVPGGLDENLALVLIEKEHSKRHYLSA